MERHWQETKGKTQQAERQVGQGGTDGEFAPHLSQKQQESEETTEGETQQVEKEREPDILVKL